MCFLPWRVLNIGSNSTWIFQGRMACKSPQQQHGYCTAPTGQGLEHEQDRDNGADDQGGHAEAHGQLVGGARVALLQKQIARTAGEGDVPLACRHITDDNTNICKGFPRRTRVTRRRDQRPACEDTFASFMAY